MFLCFFYMFYRSTIPNTEFYEQYSKEIIIYYYYYFEMSIDRDIKTNFSKYSPLKYKVFHESYIIRKSISWKNIDFERSYVIKFNRRKEKKSLIYLNIRSRFHILSSSSVIVDLTRLLKENFIHIFGIMTTDIGHHLVCSGTVVIISSYFRV